MPAVLTPVDLKRHQNVLAWTDLPGVPAGTKGRVLQVSGVSWIRYRVRFENGVEHGLLDEDEFREFVFENPVRFYTRLNPEFFAGTRVEAAAAELVRRERARAAASRRRKAAPARRAGTRPRRGG